MMLANAYFQLHKDSILLSDKFITNDSRLFYIKLRKLKHPLLPDYLKNDEFLEVSLEFYRSLIKEKEEKRFFELGLRRLKYQRKKGLR